MNVDKTKRENIIVRMYQLLNINIIEYKKNNKQILEYKCYFNNCSIKDLYSVLLYKFLVQFNK